MRLMAEKKGGKLGTLGDDIRIRKVKMLDDRAREKANQKGLNENDLVIVRTVVNSLPTYEIEKIDGSPIKYLQKKILKSS